MTWRVLVVSALSFSLSCRPEEVEVLEQYGVQREWIPFVDFIDPQQAGDSNYVWGEVEGAFPWYTLKSVTSPIEIERVSTGRTGNACVEFRNTGEASSNAGIARWESPLDLLGSQAILSCYYKTTDLDGKIVLHTMVRDRSTWKRTMDTISAPVHGRWTQASKSVDIPADANSFSFGVEVIGRGSVRFDDFDVLRGKADPSVARVDRVFRPNMGFEDKEVRIKQPWPDTANMRLKPWWLSYYGKEYLATLDSSIATEGRYSMRLQSNNPTKVGEVDLPYGFDANYIAGYQTEFAIDLKAEGLRGVVSLLAAVSGEDTTVVGSLQTWDLSTRSGWQTYRLVVDAPDRASDGAFRITLTGEGTVWVDNLRLTRKKLVAKSQNHVDRTGYFAKPVNMGFEYD